VGNNSLASGNGILGSGQGAGASIHINPQGAVGLDLGYFAPTANNPVVVSELAMVLMQLLVKSASMPVNTLMWV
jgi:hypothetical protein